ncbi:MAG: linear amide C-N hydrolase [Sedimentisphaerales bacterium]|nr:linear amide C-N hydrolase [Sedimentisphaerales bacterium]
MRMHIPTLLCYSLLICVLVGPSQACTSFCMDTPDGPVFGYNLDLFIPADGHVFINQRGMAKESFPSQAGTKGDTLKWISKYGSVTFNLVGREWANTGMNEAGLVISNMELLASEFPARDERPALPIGPWAQYVLDTCGSVQEAVHVDSKMRIEDSTPPVHYLIADAEGNCASIEWMEGKFVCHTGKDLPVKAMSNMPYARALAAYKRGGPRWWWSNPGRSAQRFAAAHTRSVSYDADQEPDAVKYAFGTLVEAVSAPHTKWSIVYDIAKREIWYGTVVSRPVKHISLEKMDFACGGPLQMQDVNAGLEGDVETFFTPYDHDINLETFRTFCRRYGHEISEGEIIGVMKHIESFECAD